MHLLTGQQNSRRLCFKMSIRSVCKNVLSDALVVGLALNQLVLFVLILRSSDHSILIGESNQVILIIEVVLFSLFLAWGIKETARKLKE